MKTKVCFTFDDNFKESFSRIAELYESFGIRALFACVGRPPSDWEPIGLGDWKIWNELVARGHAVEPHGLDHSNFSEKTEDQAREDVLECIKIYRSELEGFDPNRSFWHYPFNTDLPSVNPWILEHFAGIRSGGTGMNTESDLNSRILRVTTFGPGDCGSHLRETIDQAERIKPKLLFYCMHGVDGQGWGPIKLTDLSEAIKRIKGSEQFEMINPADLIPLVLRVG